MSKENSFSNLVEDLQANAFETSEEVINNNFESILKEVKDSTYNCKSVAYIDTEIHDILARLKSKKGVNIGKLLSHLTKEFIESNKKDITKALKNDYLG